jgi:hypothetical protein
MLSMAGAVKHCLEVFAHGSEFLGPYIERIVHSGRLEGCAEVDHFAQVLDIQELIEIVSRSKHREVSAFICPVVE